MVAVCPVVSGIAPALSTVLVPLENVIVVETATTWTKLLAAPNPTPGVSAAPFPCMISAPARCAELTQLQDRFSAVLQKNMVVLATAHAVSEGIMRRLSGDLARKAAPQVYGASGRAASPNPRHGRPLAVSRSL